MIIFNVNLFVGFNAVQLTVICLLIRYFQLPYVRYFISFFVELISDYGEHKEGGGEKDGFRVGILC